jgi:hypothetical protein
MIASRAGIAPLIHRLRSEYTEMPTLRLTAVQIERLCDADRLVCESVLAAIVDVGYLTRNGDGTYVRGRAHWKAKPGAGEVHLHEGLEVLQAESIELSLDRRVALARRRLKPVAIEDGDRAVCVLDETGLL